MGGRRVVGFVGFFADICHIVTQKGEHISIWLPISIEFMNVKVKRNKKTANLVTLYRDEDVRLYCQISS